MFHNYYFWAIRPKLYGNCAFAQTFHTRKASEISVFFVVSPPKILFFSLRILCHRSWSCRRLNIKLKFFKFNFSDRWDVIWTVRDRDKKLLVSRILLNIITYSNIYYVSFTHFCILHKSSKAKFTRWFARRWFQKAEETFGSSPFWI